MIYEYPLNNQVQLCLILEQLFKEGDFYLKRKTLFDNVQNLRIILEIMKIIEHRDLRIKLLQNLQMYAQKIKEIASIKQVDKRKSNTILKQIAYYIDTPVQEGGINELNKNYFLSIMRRNYLQGTFNSNNSFAQAWLQQNESIRTTQLFQWFGAFNKLREMIDLSLKLLRTSVKWETVKAKQGNYLIEQPAQLIRINIGEIKSIYPRFEIYQHAVTISFYNLEINSPSLITDYDLNFDLALCKL